MQVQSCCHIHISRPGKSLLERVKLKDTSTYTTNSSEALDDFSISSSTYSYDTRLNHSISSPWMSGFVIILWIHLIRFFFVFDRTKNIFTNRKQGRYVTNRNLQIDWRSLLIYNTYVWYCSCQPPSQRTKMRKQKSEVWVMIRMRFAEKDFFLITSIRPVVCYACLNSPPLSLFKGGVVRNLQINEAIVMWILNQTVVVVVVVDTIRHWWVLEAMGHLLGAKAASQSWGGDMPKQGSTSYEPPLT